MGTMLTAQSIGISELRESPARAFEQAGDSAVVVLNHNRPAGYIVSPTRAVSQKTLNTTVSHCDDDRILYAISDHSPIGNQS